MAVSWTKVNVEKRYNSRVLKETMKVEESEVRFSHVSITRLRSQATNVIVNDKECHTNVTQMALLLLESSLLWGCCYANLWLVSLSSILLTFLKVMT